MWCVRCKHDVIDCICPDIEQRLSQLLGSPAELAAAGNLRARRTKDEHEDVLRGRFRLRRTD